MNKLLFVFESDPTQKIGTPRLVPKHVSSQAWSTKDTQQLEDQLRRQYESLIQKGQSVLHVNGRLLTVCKQPGDTTRQPTLEIWAQELPTSAPTPSPPLVPASALIPRTGDWVNQWLNLVETRLKSEEAQKILPAERKMLELVLEQWREHPAESDWAMILFVSAITMSDRVSRNSEPTLPQPYPMALSGLERMLSGNPVTPWGTLNMSAEVPEPPSWIARLCRTFTGHHG